jgi:hypothetical protein
MRMGRESGMVVLRILFLFGLALVVVHRLILAITPGWFDLFVMTYVAVVVALIALVAIKKKRKQNAEM